MVSSVAATIGRKSSYIRADRLWQEVIKKKRKIDELPIIKDLGLGIGVNIGISN